MKYFSQKRLSTTLLIAIVIVVALIFAFSSFIKQAQANWYTTGGTWTYRKTITIDNVKVPNTNQTDFPVLVDITDSDLAASARSDGFDIFFTSSDGTTKLAHEREVYTTATGRLTAWVKVPTLSTSVDTVIYIYYGNASASDMQDVAPVKALVWDGDYMAVWHMSSSVTTVNDSTSNARTGTKRATGEPAAISGKISDAQDFDGNATSGGNDYINVGTTDILTGRETNWTICAWVQAQGSKDNGWAGTIYSRITTEGTPSGAFQFAVVDPTGAPGTGGADADFIDVYTNSGSDNTAWADSGPGTGAWVHYCAVRTAAGTVSFYKNGASDGSDPFTAPSVAASQVQTIGTSWQSGSNDQIWHGFLDEIRLSDIARSADWITTEYNNQSATSTFYQIGGSETEPVVSSNAHVTVRGKGGANPSVNIRGSGATGHVKFR